MTHKVERRVPSGAEQLALFRHVADAYAASHGELDNQSLYARVANSAGIDCAAMSVKDPIGNSAHPRNLVTRKIRWHQQTMKHLGLLERDCGKRGVWRLTGKGRKQLRRINSGVSVLGFSTRLGIAVWGECTDVFSKLQDPIHLCVSSPPYPLKKPRAYGNCLESEYVDFILRSIEPVVKNLIPGGSIALNVSNDIFEDGNPTRSLYLERLILALHDNLGLSLCDRLIWHNPSKPPGPIQWASKTRQQLNVSYEHVIWMTNDPSKLRSNNLNVLVPHSKEQKMLIASGGEKRHASYGDGAYVLKPGGFGNDTEGMIPRNIIRIGHKCKSRDEYRAKASKAGLPIHGAAFPLRLCEFLIKFLSNENDLVVDPFAGTFTLGRAAENLGRRWIGTEVMLEYVVGGSLRFSTDDPLVLN